MKKNILIITGIILLIILPAALVTAQSTSTGRAGRRRASTFTLTITSNVKGASVYINGAPRKGSPPMSVSGLNPGDYTITVRAPGYEDFNITVTINSDQTVHANLRPSTYQLTVTANVKGASVYINDSLKGSIPFHGDFPPGNYKVTVTADGYDNFTGEVPLNKNETIHANLKRTTFKLTITSNINGANVFIDGAFKGNIPHHETLQPGTYTVKVSANGYFDYVSQVTVSKNTNIHAQLQPSTATIVALLPNPEILFFVDERQVKSPVQVEAGTHTIRFVSGGFSVEGEYQFEAGKTYQVEPVLTVKIE